MGRRLADEIVPCRGSRQADFDDSHHVFAPARIRCWMTNSTVPCPQLPPKIRPPLLFPLFALQDDQKYPSFVYNFNHRQADFDYKRMLDSMGHDTSQLPRD